MDIKPIIQQLQSRDFINAKDNVYTATPYQESEVVRNWLQRIGSVSMYLTMHLASEATQTFSTHHNVIHQEPPIQRPLD
jgi:hypothetical protein